VLNLVPEQRIVLNPCLWDTYEALLMQQADRSAPRFTYSEGMLEIMSPSPEHEEFAYAVETIVQAACEQFQIPFRPLRSTTQRRADLQKGAEPDASFLFGDVSRDPNEHPPDLIIEVEISRSALDKLTIFAQLGVPEVWRCSLEGVRLYRLSGGTYARVDKSGFLALDASWIERLLATKRSQDWLPWIRGLRQELSGL